LWARFAKPRYPLWGIFARSDFFKIKTSASGGVKTEEVELKNKKNGF